MKDVDRVHTAHNAQNVAHYHCSKDRLTTFLDFSNHRFFLAPKLHKASQIRRFCPAIRLVALLSVLNMNITGVIFKLY